MRLRPDTWAMTALLGLLTAFGPISTDMYLPSLPDMTRELQASTAETQLTLSVFLIGFALGQVAYGPLSDRYGRRRPLLASLALYVAASAACALATSIEALIVARFLQAIGACGPIVLARAIVRDLYEGARAGRELSRMGTIMGLVPAVAPVIGGVLHTGFGWPSSFWATALFGFVAILLVALQLPETVREKNLAPISPLGVARTYGALLENRAYVAHMAMFSLAYGGLFAFISGSSFVLQDVYGLPPALFGAAFGFTVVGFIAGTLAGARLVAKRGVDATLGVGVGFLALGGVLMLAGIASGWPNALAALIPATLYTFGVGFTMPNAMAGALTPFPEKAGAASSLMGFVQMSFAALVGVSVGHALDFGAWPMGLASAIMGVVAVVVFAVSRRARAAV